jgi:hypothetical protein
VLARKNILLAHYPHIHPADQKQGLHYSVFGADPLRSGKRNQSLAGPQGPASLMNQG